MYYIRTKIDVSDNGAVEFGTAREIAFRLARENPGLTFEVAEDKVWSSFRTATE